MVEGVEEAGKGCPIRIEASHEASGKGGTNLRVGDEGC